MFIHEIHVSILVFWIKQAKCFGFFKLDYLKCDENLVNLILCTNFLYKVELYEQVLKLFSPFLVFFSPDWGDWESDQNFPTYRQKK